MHKEDSKLIRWYSIKEHSTYKYEEVCNEEEVLDRAGHAALHGDEFVLLKGSPWFL